MAAVPKSAKALGLEHDDFEGASWWLPAEPAPIECRSIAEAVREFARLHDHLAAAPAPAETREHWIRDALNALAPFAAHARRQVVDEVVDEAIVDTRLRAGAFREAERVFTEHAALTRATERERELRAMFENAPWPSADSILVERGWYERLRALATASPVESPLP